MELCLSNLPLDFLLSCTLDQLDSIFSAYNRIESRNAAVKLSLCALAAQGKGKDISKQIKNLTANSESTKTNDAAAFKALMQRK